MSCPGETITLHTQVRCEPVAGAVSAWAAEDAVATAGLGIFSPAASFTAAAESVDEATVNVTAGVPITWTVAAKDICGLGVGDSAAGTNISGWLTYPSSVETSLTPTCPVLPTSTPPPVPIVVTPMDSDDGYCGQSGSSPGSSVGQYTATLMPTVAGNATLTMTLASSLLTGSKTQTILRQIIVKAAPVAPAETSVEGNAQSVCEAGVPATLTVTARDAFGMTVSLHNVL